MPVRQALVLGAVHGPAELLPVSSSGHVAVLPWLLGWRYSELDAELRKSFEVALHAGSALAWIGSGATGRPGPRRDSPGRLMFLILATVPAGLAGLALERPIEQRLGTPGSVAAGLVLGAGALAAADRAPERRDEADARPQDGLWIGLAQACALLPGVSRSGATLAAARARRFKPRAAWRLSAQLATPVVAGATALKLARMIRRRPAPAVATAMLAGGGASFAGTLACARLLRPVDRGWPLAPFAAYRLGLALAVVVRLRRSDPDSRARPSRSAAG